MTAIVGQPYRTIRQLIRDRFLSSSLTNHHPSQQPVSAIPVPTT